MTIEMYNHWIPLIYSDIYRCTKCRGDVKRGEGRGTAKHVTYQDTKDTTEKALESHI